ncbi:MAG TPA: hypothetical protein VHT73_01990 [Thermodesulfobacteriota bacterium]|nr:hypothetical protein [Thermodesulfobacteriota bacterium]
MREFNFERQIIILFDEQGTPTFRPDRETDYFLGVAVSYELYNEKEIFNTCNRLFGLSNNRPLKNRQISNSRAEEISDLIIQLPIQAVVRSLSLSNHEFQQVMTLYEELGNLLRRKHRQIRERPLAQILHSNILDECIFNSMVNNMERYPSNSIFSAYIDDWSISRNDIKIYLEYRSQSIEDRVNSLFEKFNMDCRIVFSPISLLNEDSPKKRLIDVFTSAISRSFLRDNNERFSKVPLQKILTIENNQYEDFTERMMVL